MFRQSLLTLMGSVFLVLSVQADECTYRRASPVFESTDFSPQLTDDMYQINPQLETNATLFRRGQNGDLIPELGQSFEIDYEAKKLIVDLNPNCGWSDGTNITAHDYVEGLRLLFRPDAKDTYIPGRELFKQASRILSGEFPPSALGVRAEGSHKVVFDLIAPPDMLMTISSYVAMTPAPTHLLKEDPKAWPNASIVRVSSGPFVAVEQTKERIVMERNPHYCQGYEHGVTRIELINQHDLSQGYSMLKAGKVDVAEGLSKQKVEALLEEKPDTWLTKDMSEKMLQYLYISQVMADKPALRQAILSSVDRQYLVNEAFKNVYVYEYDSLNFNYRGYPDAAFGEAFQLDHATRIERAKAAMESEGYGPDNRLSLSLGYLDYDELEPLVQALRTMLAPIYIDLKLDRIKDYGALFERDLMVAGWFADFDDPFNTLSAFAQRIGDKEPELLSAVEATNNLFDHDERFAALSQLDQQLVDTHYFLPLFMLSVPVAVDEKVSFGDERHPLGRNASKAYCFPS